MHINRRQYATPVYICSIDGTHTEAQRLPKANLSSPKSLFNRINGSLQGATCTPNIEVDYALSEPLMVD